MTDQLARTLDNAFGVSSPDFTDKLIVDSFAGGGGASEGIRLALGRDPDIAFNHDPEAMAMHKANHPTTKHYTEDVWNVDPLLVTAGRPVGLMWLSPDCKHFSKAKGGKPVSKKVRGLAWVAMRWAKAGSAKPDVIVLENVEEFQTWGTLYPPDHHVARLRNRPIPEKKGRTFKMFVGRLRGLGYEVQWRELRAADYGAPTIRKRLFLIARCDGQPIVWPTPTHGPSRAQPYRTTAECIDWSLPCPSIFLTKEEGKAIGVRRPLVVPTMRRIARGVFKYVINSSKPFIVQYYSPKRDGDDRIADVSEPAFTQTTENRFGLVAPYLIPRYGEREGQAPRTLRVDAAGPTIVPTQNGAQLVSAFLAQHYDGNNKGSGISVEQPAGTLTTKDHHALITSHLLKFRGTSLQGQLFEDPAPAITAGGLHLAEVRAFLVSYYGTNQNTGDLNRPAPTIPTKDRLGLVTVHGTEYIIVDIGMRMLRPRELFRIQGFGDHYIIDGLRWYDRTKKRWRVVSGAGQVRMVGNSVCPDLACALVAANVPHLAAERMAA